MARDQVRVTLPNRGVTPPPPAEEEDFYDFGTLEERQSAGSSLFGPFLTNLRDTILGGTPGVVPGVGPGGGPAAPIPELERTMPRLPSVLDTAPKQRGAAPEKDIVEEILAGPTTTPSGQTFSEMIAGYQFDGSPYDAAADYLMERRAAQMRAVQDMYNQYAAETQANVDRIGDIYGGAEAGIGETYGSATQNIEDAYASAQQQAADQMARLGIEEAAPTVMDPMALSQAETLSGLETNRASGLGATQRFGATAGDFATTMAQVAQQGALENQRSATEQLADQLFELEMQRAQAQAAYNPYQRAMQEIEAQQAFENFYNPQPDTEAAQRAAELQLETTLSRQDKVLQLWSDIRQDYDSDEEAFAAAQAAIQQAEAMFPIQ